MTRARLIAVLCLITLGLLCGGCGERREGNRPGGANRTAAILAQAPSFQVILDVSGSSPALDAAIMDSVAPVIAAQIQAMPAGTLVTVATVGDATVAQGLLRARIDRRGNSAEAVARKLERLLRDFPAQMRERAQGRSDLVGGFAAAAADVNRGSDGNLIVMVSDLAEHSAIAECGGKRRCTLPIKPGFDLGGAQVQVYGVGQGLPSDRALQLTQEWRAFLARAKAGAVALRRF